jgi:hypothetical protein
MTLVTIIGNKPLGPNGENEQWPEVTEDLRIFATIEGLCRWYQSVKGPCSSIMITIVDPPE